MGYMQKRKPGMLGTRPRVAVASSAGTAFLIAAFGSTFHMLIHTAIIAGVMLLFTAAVIFGLMAFLASRRSSPNNPR